MWTSKGQRFATPTAAVVEVIPVVQSRPIPGSEPWLTGMFDYRGQLMPLLDSSRLLGLDASDLRMSSRILVINVGQDSEQKQNLAGLVVEHVLGSDELEFDEESAASSAIDFVGPVALTPTGTVQLTVPARLPSVQSTS